MNNSLPMDPMCFGKEFVNKTKQIYTMSQHGFWHNIIPEVAIAYQFYYMLGEKCKFERAMNDLYRFCWNKGCAFGEMEDSIVKNILYMTRAILDACIVWYEGVPEDEAHDIAQWHKLSMATGESIAEILKEVTNF